MGGRGSEAPVWGPHAMTLPRSFMLSHLGGSELGVGPSSARGDSRGQRLTGQCPLTHLVAFLQQELGQVRAILWGEETSIRLGSTRGKAHGPGLETSLEI